MTFAPVRQRHGNRYENRKHWEHVSMQPCMICGGQSGPAHHLLRPWRGVRGTSRKAGDENSVPLCHGHHAALHADGNEDAWFEGMTGFATAGRDKAEREWMNSPHGVELETFEQLENGKDRNNE